MDKGRFYKPELDVLRLIAFLMVFLHHTFPRVPTGYNSAQGSFVTPDVFSSIANAFGFGLCLFFFLSAYLITSLTLIEQERTGSVHIKHFYIRRILRIWPLYFTALALGVVSASLYQGHDAEMFRYYVFFVGNWFFLDHGWSSNPFTPLWSISVEEQFYLFLPLFVTFVGRKRISAGAIALMLGSVGYLFFEGVRHASIDVVIWVNTFSQLMFFGAGIWIASVMHGKKVQLKLTPRLMLFAAALILFFVGAFSFEAKMIGPASSGISVAMGYFVVMAACVCITLAFLDCSFSFPALLVYLGKISFGLYVFHLFGITIMHVVFASQAIHASPIVISACALPLVVLFAHLSYQCLELPFLRLRKKFTCVENRPN